MADDRNQWADRFSAEPGGGWLTSFLAEEHGFDRRAKLRLGLWGVGALGAVVVAVLASQSSVQQRREHIASADLLSRQSEQIQSVAAQTQAEARRLSAAIETLNQDRDRLYTRVTSVEQGLESVTGSIKRQAAAPAAPAPSPVAEPPAPQASAAPLIGPVLAATPAEPPAKQVAEPAAKQAAVVPTAAPATAEPAAPRPSPSLVAASALPAMSGPLMTARSMMAPPDPAATKLSEPAAPPAAEPMAETTSAIAPETAAVKAELPAVPVQRTEFGVDLGSANSVDGLRALWRGLVASHKALAGLRPVIMVKERTNGYGMRLRLVAGPLGDAAAAAKLCAVMSESGRGCDTSVFDGQRLALKNESPPLATPPAATAARPAAPTQRHRGSAKPEQRSALPPAAKPVEEPAPPPKPQSSLTSILGLN
ncbi:hypothetical protein [Rhodopseudomonas sp. RCAM05734]|uniref:hypothetical protein n=1 Tax=Rhodopseudomonas sp. RCAM05734 TaxID=3457549 RepID=UPI00404420C9